MRLRAVALELSSTRTDHLAGLQVRLFVFRRTEAVVEVLRLRLHSARDVVQFGAIGSVVTRLDPPTIASEAFEQVEAVGGELTSLIVARDVAVRDAVIAGRVGGYA